MENLKNKLFSKTKVLAQKMMEKDARGWPPPCLGFIYQPVRPKTAPVFEEKSIDNSSKK